MYHLRSFELSGVHVHRGFLLHWTLRRFHQPYNVDDIVVPFLQLALRKVRQQMFVSAVPINDNYFLAPVSRHLVSGFLQQLQLQAGTVRDGARFMAGFEDLPEIVFGKNYRVLLLCGGQSGVTNVQQVSPQGEVRPMFFENPEWKETCPVRSLNSAAEFGCAQFSPMDGKIRLRQGRY